MDSSNKISYSKRLFLWLLAYSLLLVSGCVYFQYHREKKFLEQQINAQLQLINRQILHESDPDSGILPPIARYPFEELRISVIDSTGRVLYDNTLDSLPPNNHLDRKEIAEAYRFGQGYTVRRHSSSNHITYFYSALRGNHGYVIRTAVPYTVSLDELLRTDYGFLWFMGGLTLLMCVLGYFATRRIGSHILRLNRFAEQAERGERIYDTAPFPKDELGSISNHIVHLYANLQQAVAERDREHQTAMHEQMEKERIKKQLTNNINHELKTPVASIQLCVETLLTHPDISEEKRQDFLQRCMANTERLKNLLENVSLITRIEDGRFSIQQEPLDLQAILTETIEEYRPLAARKGIVIETQTGGSLPVTGNRELLATVFRNLLDNAITHSGGTKIEIREEAAPTGERCLTFADNGCGVPSEHLPHLFERFYRVDKGRSRAAGGTGLGLAIVKNTLGLHGGRITVENRRNGGLLFRLFLPKK